MNSIFVTELACKQCGTHFNGLPTDKIFTCSNCRFTVQVHHARQTPLPLKVAKITSSVSRTGDESIIYLPFWKIPVQTIMTNPDGDKIDLSMMHNPEHVWVGAFIEMHAAYMGNPGLDMTKDGVNIEETSQLPDDKILIGGSRTGDGAIKYAEIFVTNILDFQNDISDHTLNIKTGVPEYFAIPFLFNASKFTLTNLTCAKTYNAIVVEEIRQILRTHKIIQT